MKTLFLSIIMVGMAIMLHAQNTTSGTIIYERVVKLDIQMEGESAQFADILPTESKVKKCLYFTQNESLCENIKEEEKEEVEEMAEGGVLVKMQEPDNKVYLDLKNKRMIEQQDFMSRMFLIESDMEKDGWKLTGNQKKVLGYTCQEAIMEKDDRKTVAWFTPEIPVSTGPIGLNGLPGMVLAADINDGKETITALKIDTETPDESLIVKPKKGKKISKEKYRVLVDEKMKEMGASEGKGGARVIVKTIRQ